MTKTNNFPLMIYQTPDGGVTVDVQIDQDTIRLNQDQLSRLFDIDRTVITKHIRNIYKEGELSEKSTCAKFAQVQKEGQREVTRQVNFYNLDMIISVGYRVNSKQATHFRIRATSVLKDHILKGHSLNHHRLQQIGIEHLQDSIALIKRTLENTDLSHDESKGLVELITRYIPSLITLNRYDSGTLPHKGKTNQEKYTIDQQEARAVLEKLKNQMIQAGEATELFAKAKDHAGLDAIFGAIYQGFGGQDVYPSVEEKAANLLYLTIKNHPFADGNKRSGAFLFVRYLSKNDILYTLEGQIRISEQTLVALALLVATSDPKEKDIIIQLIIYLISS